MPSCSRRIFTKSGLAAGLGLAGLFRPWKVVLAGTPPGQDEPEPTLAEIMAGIRDLRTKYDSLTHNLNVHSQFDPPIGTVMAYAGSWPPINPATGEKRSEFELGWALADGRSFLDPTLMEARPSLEDELGKLLGATSEPATVLPNYCGVFLRGLDLATDGRTTGRDKGVAGAPLARSGANKPGATAMPLAAFTNSTAPDHTHHIPTYVGGDRAGSGLNEVGVGAFSSYDYGNAPPTDAAGQHSHTISGGDSETRPINVAVHYIIKFRSI